MRKECIKNLEFIIFFKNIQLYRDIVTQMTRTRIHTGVLEKFQKNNIQQARLDKEKQRQARGSNKDLSNQVKNSKFKL